MKKAPLILLFLAVTMFLPRCVNYQRWPAYENRAEARLIEMRETIGRGVATGQITNAEADDLLDRLDALRGDYNAIEGDTTTEEAWEDLFDRLNDLEEDIDEALTDDGQVIGAAPIPEKLSDLQSRIDEGLRNGTLTHMQARDLQVRLDDIRLDYLEEAPTDLSAAEMAEIEARIEDLEQSIDLAI